MERHPVAEIVAFNQPLLGRDRRVRSKDGRDLTAEAVGRKLEALARGPFPFFRGTFHLMARDVLQKRVPLVGPRAPEGLIVGDLHLENFGAYRGASGDRCFDVNDFDDVGFGPLDLDLQRLCTSAFLLPGLDAASRAAAAKAIAEGWAEGVQRLGGRFPVRPLTADRADPPVKQLLAERHGKQIDALDPQKSVPVEARFTAAVEASIDEWRASLEQLKAVPPKGKVEAVVYRFRGTGSLGRLRFWAVLRHGEGRSVVEIKEARPSELDVARGEVPAGERARMQAASIRRLQGDPWPSIAGTHVAGLPALGRVVEGDDEKISADRFASEKSSREELVGYARQCGEVLSRTHVRESAPQMLAAKWDVEKVAAAAVDFARAYSKIVESDHAAFVKSRPEVTKSLSL